MLDLGVGGMWKSSCVAMWNTYSYLYAGQCMLIWGWTTPQAQLMKSGIELCTDIALTPCGLFVLLFLSHHKEFFHVAFFFWSINVPLDFDGFLPLAQVGGSCKSLWMSESNWQVRPSVCLLAFNCCIYI